jgi:predicted GTPase
MKDIHQATQNSRTRVIIMGAAGRDFHNFNMVFRANPGYQVVAFTAAQIPGIANRLYPPALSGPRYPEGVPILPEEELPGLVQQHQVDWVYLSYSDLSHLEVMHKASLVLASGASFGLLGTRHTYLRAGVPVIAVCAVRTGAGKSPTTRRVARFFLERGRPVVVIRHPMPYGDLDRQVCQRFATVEDLDLHQCTIEEREEYEPLVRMGVVVYAGVDYEEILRQAEQEARFIIWDGGNNDLPFVRPDLHLVVLDPHRAGHELAYHPGETNLRMADILVINKVDSASQEQLDLLQQNIALTNPRAEVIRARSELSVDHPERIQGRTVLIVGDGPTLTHGGMGFGAGTLAAQRFGASAVVDGRKYAAGSLQDTYRENAHLGMEVPAMGYSSQQVRELEATINRAEVDTVIVATPVDLSRLIKVKVPIARVTYEVQEEGDRLTQLLTEFEKQHLSGVARLSAAE